MQRRSENYSILFQRLKRRVGGYRVTVDVEEVRELVVSGMRLKDIAKKLGVSKTTVDNYIKKYDLRNGKR